jgi:hypothetical protein
MALSSDCPAQGTPLDTYDAAAHIPMSSPFSLAAGSVITVWTQNLAVLPAPLTGSSPDTLLYLLRCADSRCTTGTVVAVDDDDNPSPQALDSWLQYTVPRSGTFRWLVTDWRQGNEGSCDVYVQIDAGAAVPALGQVFGGYHHFANGLAHGDAVLVGKNNNTAALVASGASPAHPALQADPEYADTMVFAVSSTVTNCDSGNCAEFWFNDDGWTIAGSDTAYLSRLPIPTTANYALHARVVVGTYGNWASVAGVSYPKTSNVRIMHVRRHVDDGGYWSCPEQRDVDHDQLPFELEQLLGSCDSVDDALTTPMGAVGYTCTSWAQRVNTLVNYWQPGTNCAVNPPTTLTGNANCWSATDSDNDGISDLWEVFAAAAQFSTNPAPPDTDAGAPTALNIHTESVICPTAWCTAYDSSALSDPSPSQFDIYFQYDAVRCTGTHCGDDYGLNTLDHGITQYEQAVLKKIFTTKTGSCWDGSTTWPCPREIDASRDLLYKMRMHAYSLAPATGAQPGPARWAEAKRNGVAEAMPWFNHSFRPSWKFLRLFHYGLLTRDQGQTVGFGRVSVIGNEFHGLAEQADVTQRVIAHESGHQLSLSHPHEAKIGPASGPNLPPDASAGTCAPGICQTDATCQCKAETLTCTVGDGTALESNKPNNPAAPTLMNYRYSWGQLPADANMAVPTEANQSMAGCGSCLREEAAFSKGLDGDLAELTLPESVGLDWSGSGSPAWRMVKTVRDLQCFNRSGDDGLADGQNGSCGPLGIGSGRGPVCAQATYPSQCTFDWDYNDAYSTAPVRFDVSRGPFDNLDACNKDTLRDVDEVGRITALSKQAVRPGTYGSYAVYSDVFNGTSAPFNYAGWPASQLTSQNIVISQATYTRNFCAADADCVPANPNGFCRFDSCTSAATCRNPSLTCGGTGACTCNTDDDCWSGRCVGSGGNKVCSLEVGTCGCPSPTAAGVCNTLQGEIGCEVGSQNHLPSCNRERNASAIGSPDYKMWESAQFASNNAASWIRIDGATGTPLRSIGAQNGFALFLDFYWDGFQSGESVEVLLDLGIAWLTIEKDANGLPRVVGRLVYNGAPANTALVSAAPIETRRWYRISWVVTSWTGYGGQTSDWLDVWPRNRATGWFDTATDEQCVWRKLGLTLDLPAPSEARFGSPINNMGEFFRGRMDNITLFNSPYQHSKPTQCAELTGGVP